MESKSKTFGKYVIRQSLISKFSVKRAHKNGGKPNNFQFHSE